MQQRCVDLRRARLRLLEALDCLALRARELRQQAIIDERQLLSLCNRCAGRLSGIIKRELFPQHEFFVEFDGFLIREGQAFSAPQPADHRHKPHPAQGEHLRGKTIIRGIHINRNNHMPVAPRLLDVRLRLPFMALNAQLYKDPAPVIELSQRC